MAMTTNEKLDMERAWQKCLSIVPTRSRKEYKSFKALWTRLCHAAAEGDATLVGALLFQGACGGHGNSLALRLAARKGHGECVEMLIPSFRGWGIEGGLLTAMEEAAGQGRRGCVEILISAPEMEPDLWMGLRSAAFWGQVDCVDSILPWVGADKSEGLMELARDVENIGAEGGDVVAQMLRARREGFALEQAIGEPARPARPARQTRRI